MAKHLIAHAHGTTTGVTLRTPKMVTPYHGAPRELVERLVKGSNFKGRCIDRDCASGVALPDRPSCAFHPRVPHGESDWRLVHIIKLLATRGKPEITYVSEGEPPRRSMVIHWTSLDNRSAWAVNGA